LILGLIQIDEVQFSVILQAVKPFQRWLPARCPVIGLGKALKILSELIPIVDRFQITEGGIIDLKG
jgi:hypothetical protein